MLSVFELKDELGLADEAQLVAGDAFHCGRVLFHAAHGGAELTNLLIQPADLGVGLYALAAQVLETFEAGWGEYQDRHRNDCDREDPERERAFHEKPAILHGATLQHRLPMAKKTAGARGSLGSSDLWKYCASADLAMDSTFPEAVRDDELPIGAKLGDFVIMRRLGTSALGTAYVAKRGDDDFRIKVVRFGRALDRGWLERFLAYGRLLASFDLPELGRDLVTLELDGRLAVCQRYVVGETLADRLARSGAERESEFRLIAEALFESLCLLHERRLSHGNLKLQNVLLENEGEELRVVLLDAGWDRLRRLGSVFCQGAAPPEQLLGQVGDLRSDVYACGLVLHQLLSGKPFADDERPLETALRHLGEPLRTPSSLNPHGLVGRELEVFVLALLEKQPSRRPPDAFALLQKFQKLGRRWASDRLLSERDMDELVSAVIERPLDASAADSLDAAVAGGLDPERAVATFCHAADGLGDAHRDAKKTLLFRAARLCEHETSDLERAERIYGQILAQDPSDAIATAALEDVFRRLGKYAELTALLRQRAERAASEAERARAFAEIGRVFAQDLKDNAQALAAFTRAFCEAPEQAHYADEIERLAPAVPDAYVSVLDACLHVAATRTLTPESESALQLRMAGWYDGKLGRQDLAQSYYEAILTKQPAHDAAFDGLCRIQRKNQQWSELASALLRHADLAATRARARDLRAEAAEVFEAHLKDLGTARVLYERIFDEDPTHTKAYEALGRLYEQTHDHAARARLLERRAETSQREERLAALYKLAEVHEKGLGSDANALLVLRAIVSERESELEALRGIDRLLSKAGRHAELVANLEAQVLLVATPRQKIVLFERLARLCAEEFLDHERAGGYLQKILEIDPANASAFDALVERCREQEQWERMAELYDRQLELPQEDSRRLSLLLASAALYAEHLGLPERAIRTYERALELDPHETRALSALAELWEAAGDSARALSAIDALVSRASSPEAAAALHLRAAQLHEARGESESAILRYQRALDADPASATAAARLRQLHVARGDHLAAMKLLEHELDATSGERAKARLAAELAELFRHNLKDDKRAEEAARRAIGYDPTSVTALTILGDLAFEKQHFLEASRHYEGVTERIETLAPSDALRVLVRHIESLCRAGLAEQAQPPLDSLWKIAPDDLETWLYVDRLMFEHAAPPLAASVGGRILTAFDARLAGKQRALAFYRHGEALRRAGDLSVAIAALETAADLDPADPMPLVALASAHEARDSWTDVVKAKTRQLDLAEGDDRFQLLLQIGEIAAERLNDHPLAVKNLLLALEDRPDDRRLLTKLMHLYSEDKEWNGLVDVVLRLAQFVDEPKQKGKYLHTAAIVANRQLGDPERALEIYAAVLALDPDHEKAQREVIEIELERGNYSVVETILERRLEHFRTQGDRTLEAATHVELAELYDTKLGSPSRAIEHLEEAQELEPDNRERAELLAELYARDPETYFDKAVTTLASVLRESPYHAGALTLLRQLYTDAKHTDGAFCLCQAKYALSLAEPDEERFFRRFRSDAPVRVSAPLSERDWSETLLHDSIDRTLTRLFSVIEPAVLAAQSLELEELGYAAEDAVDSADRTYPIGQSLSAALALLGIDAPSIFENPEEDTGLSFLHAQRPAILLGNAALNADIPAQAAAFIAARHVSYFRPGLYLRQVAPSQTALKTWLIAAVKSCTPDVPVPPELESPVAEALAALERELSDGARSELAGIVREMLESGASLDLKQWITGVDLTADRAGFVASNDLETALEIVKASDEQSSSVPITERVEELIRYAVSPAYLALRESLGIAIAR